MMDRKQIAELLGIQPATFRKCVEPKPGFPKPVLRLSQKLVLWDDRDIERWMSRQKQLAQA
ncbi:MAG TPA: AlpA family phage regulatory protein [Roseateles sp.]